MVYWFGITTGGGPNLDDQGYNVALDNSGNVFVAGMLSPSNSVYFNDIHVTFSITAQNPFFIAKYLANGTVQWVRYVYGTIWDKYVIISDMDCLSDGSIVAAGGYSQPLLMFSNGFSSVGPQMAGQDDFFLTRFSADGDRMWVNLSPPINGAEGGMVVSVENEVIHLLRNFEGTITNDVDTLTSYGNLDLLLEQYDPSGNLLSYTQYGGTNIDGATDLMVDNNSTYVIGMTQSPTVNVGTDSFRRIIHQMHHQAHAKSNWYFTSGTSAAGTLYPNPNNGSFTISASGLVGDVRVTNVTGQVVQRRANAFGKTEVQLPKCRCVRCITNKVTNQFELKWWLHPRTPLPFQPSSEQNHSTPIASNNQSSGISKGAQRQIRNPAVFFRREE
ncbi:MAG: T9SS type A sorting domain-containing protein [Flavobacteriales bacterium]|nr:T9SS type A sorting domain-containing protein [Flavobacteriales bacterium]